jgi:tetratricopeptide (TPR) repeat protein
MNQTLSKIIQLINTESFYEAEQELRKIYNQFSNSFDINKLLGAATLAQRKYNIALKCYEKCWNKKKDYDTAVNLSFIFLKTQYYENSINFGKEALAINPAGAHSYQNIATSYFHLAKYEKAGEYALNAIDKRGGMESKNFLATEDLVALYGNILIAQRRNDEFHNFAKKILDLKYIQRILVMLLREDRKFITQKHTQLAYDAIEHAPKIQKRIERNVRYSDAYFFLAEPIKKNLKNIMF